MTTVEQSTPAGTRRRGQALEQAIFDAVFELLGTAGYAKLSMEGVAAAAKTGKAALYRRWNDKNALIVDALRSSLPSAEDVPEQATVRADAMVLLMRIRDALESSYGATFQALKAEAGPGAGLVHAAIKEKVFTPYRTLMLAALRRGVDRGEVRADAVNAVVATVGPAMLIHHNFIEGPGIPDDYVTAVVDEVIMPMLRP
ncbi:TetR-like C-terminal domain-containing protein [Actinocrispum sp. NPDC049592]|uniref:TetR-like C-terminal domain-containing protein n=1 Tax=Actinocrispum sp. NPDC049592 TaxID=3154835 RepID=UPI0034166255